MLEVATRRKRSSAVEAMSRVGWEDEPMQLFIAALPAGGVVRVDKNIPSATFPRYDFIY